MSTYTREIEARGQNVDVAIENGLAKLRVTRDKVEITVLDEGSRGLLGLGARDAMVRLTLKAEPAPPPAPKPIPEPVPAPKPAPKPAPAPRPEPVVVVPEPEPEPIEELVEEVEFSAETVQPAERPTNRDSDFGEAEFSIEDEGEIASEIIGTLLQKMGVAAEVSVEQTEPDDVTGRRVNVVNIEGEDLTLLIGPRGDTLDSIQFISRLMVGHRMHQRAQFVVDVQGHRARREQALSRMAERMAQKTVTRQSPVTLEAMPAYERRVIHMTLRDSAEVYTESIGEGNRRRVRIIPK